MTFFSMPKTTIWYHIQGIKILPKYIKIYKSKQGGSIKKSKMEWEQAKQEASRLVGSISKKERLLIAASLYWAEGAKGDFQLTNTDPDLIKTYIKCLRELGVKKDRLSVNIRVYEDINTSKACSFWSKVTGVSKKEIKYVNVLYGKKNGKLPYGMCRLRVKKGRYHFKLINSIKNIMINN
ncbi:MAG: hypothetical protein Q8Q89_03570 [bacterium]|nr:hypothetical protein [bacterium]